MNMFDGEGVLSAKTLKDNEDFLRYFYTKHPEYVYPGYIQDAGSKEEKEQHSKCLNDAYWEWLKSKGDVKE